ncbi:ORM1-like protein 1 [Larimichthys crocea]|uniref:Uncharacterized protein n=1 Tax=Larimichthys crocea TaxID=215358 RepID=A0ACD3QHS0_LARCR|nr:ORM1-like protein 1 [Larimichthys crocea]
MNSRGIWLTYALGVGILHIVLLSIPFFSVPVVWTLTNIIHNFGMYVFMHAVKGTPFETPDQGKARLLTHWEQLDYGVQFTSSRKFFTISPIILYVLDIVRFCLYTCPVNRGSPIEDATYPGVYQCHCAHNTGFSGHIKVIPGAYVWLRARLCIRNFLKGVRGKCASRVSVKRITSTALAPSNKVNADHDCMMKWMVTSAVMAYCDDSLHYWVDHHGSHLPPFLTLCPLWRQSAQTSCTCASWLSEVD